MFISKGALGVTLHPFIHISGFFGEIMCPATQLARHMILTENG